ncbi:hypothetical protein ANN_01073 [Periplaneta americana]|uniref:Uncharacterized protein n=1 Tax=Periplaneta americana TaxID=6978 RepID=A0ABQ8TSP7_PERAM|nr:hypothetical protein ANN_01073 [Periplaneta americana]
MSEQTQKQKLPGTWFSSTAFKKIERAREKASKFANNVKESSTEDENNVSSGISELDLLPKFPHAKKMMLGVCFVTAYSEDSKGELWAIGSDGDGGGGGDGSKRRKRRRRRRNRRRKDGMGRIKEAVGRG